MRTAALIKLEKSKKEEVKRGLRSLGGGEDVERRKKMGGKGAPFVDDEGYLRTCSLEETVPWQLRGISKLEILKFLGQEVPSSSS